MQLHELRPKRKLKKRKRIGRGGKRGAYSGRGLKGQKAHAGRRLEPIIRKMIKRYPKLRGYRFRLVPALMVSEVNLEVLDKKFKAGEKINPEILLERKIIATIKGKTPKVKILSKGDITKSLTIEGCSVSKSAKEKIEKAGGSVK
jgi:large subunit ribosomal protein L15